MGFGGYVDVPARDDKVGVGEGSPVGLRFGAVSGGNLGPTLRVAVVPVGVLGEGVARVDGFGDDTIRGRPPDGQGQGPARQDTDETGRQSRAVVHDVPDVVVA